MSDNKSGLGDAQGTRVGSPDQSKTATPANHNDGPSGRPERTTGAGSEPTIAADKPANPGQKKSDG